MSPSDLRDGLGGAPRSSIAARVTAGIVEALKHGVRPWSPPWDAAAALALPLRHNGLAYRGSNILILWCAAQARGYRSRRWMGFAQARELGGVVRRGERATSVTYYAPPPAKSGARKSENVNAEDASEPTQRAILRSFPVFNIEQIDGLPHELHVERTPKANCDEAYLSACFARVPAVIRQEGARAYYNPKTDIIYLPPRNAFASTAQYFATLLHELGHWTGHATRLDRELHGPHSVAAFAREELTAELCSAFLGAELGLPVDHLEDHAAYIDHWLKILDRDPGALLAAAAKAQAVADYLRALLLESPGAGA